MVKEKTAPAIIEEPSPSKTEHFRMEVITGDIKSKQVDLKKKKKKKKK